MRKLVQILLIISGATLATAGFLQNNGWFAGLGGALFLGGGIMWISSPPKPPLDDVGNRPTYDVTHHGGPGPQD